MSALSFPYDGEEVARGLTGRRIPLSKRVRVDCRSMAGRGLKPVQRSGVKDEPRLMHSNDDSGDHRQEHPGD